MHDLACLLIRLHKERCEILSQTGKMLSLPFWRAETAINACGRSATIANSRIFSRYRTRLRELRNTGLPE
ncbi:MAG: hypothetical protein GY815_18725 [Gammaproteobacteria bacterium]|nr:hypothetical protein [Gammaproteobacteria bacterium]